MALDEVEPCASADGGGASDAATSDGAADATATDASPPADSGSGCTPGQCDDGQPCTLDLCGPSGCTHVLATDGTACGGSFCSGRAACAAGACVAGPPPTDPQPEPVQLFGVRRRDRRVHAPAAPRRHALPQRYGLRRQRELPRRDVRRGAPAPRRRRQRLHGRRVLRHDGRHAHAHRGLRSHARSRRCAFRDARVDPRHARDEHRRRRDRGDVHRLRRPRGGRAAQRRERLERERRLVSPQAHSLPRRRAAEDAAAPPDRGHRFARNDPGVPRGVRARRRDHRPRHREADRKRPHGDHHRPGGRDGERLAGARAAGDRAGRARDDGAHPDHAADRARPVSRAASGRDGDDVRLRARALGDHVRVAGDGAAVELPQSPAVPDHPGRLVRSDRRALGTRGRRDMERDEVPDEHHAFLDVRLQLGSDRRSFGKAGRGRRSERSPAAAQAVRRQRVESERRLDRAELFSPRRPRARRRSRALASLRQRTRRVSQARRRARAGRRRRARYTGRLDVPDPHRRRASTRPSLCSAPRSVRRAR